MKKYLKAKEDKKEKPHAHPELEAFDIRINSFGEIVRSHKVDELNIFLDKHLPDRKVKK